MKITIEVEIDLSEPMETLGIKKLMPADISLFEYFVEKQVEDYSPTAVIERLELKPNENLARIFKEGFYVTATLQ